MNVLNKVTRKSLAKNKSRTVVTIIGIMLSAAMFMAVMTSVTSIQGYMLDVVKAQDGSWYAWTIAGMPDERDNIINDSRIKDNVILQSQGYGLIGSTNEYKPYLFIGGIQKDFTDMAAVMITEGRLPEDSGEIMLPKHLRSNGGVIYSIGDKLTVDVGHREWNGRTLTQKDAFYKADEEAGDEYALGEELVDAKARTFTVVGFYSRPGWEPRTAPGYTALTAYDDAYSDGISQVFYQTRKMKDVYDYVIERDPEEKMTAYNFDYLHFNGLGFGDSVNSMLYSTAFILSALIMFGSISLIYNAFAISVSERTVQFGILKSIGATKRQMRRSVMYEGAILALIGIPLGILAGILGMFITFKAIGELIDLTLVNQDTNVNFTIHLKWWAAAVSAVICLITVFISANIPAQRAAKKPAIEAIKQSNDVRIKGRKVRTSKLTYILFKFEGMLASKNFKRNKKRYRSTVISLFVSIVLFISASSFCGYLSNGVDITAEEYNYDIDSRITSGMTDFSFEQLEEVHNEAKGATKTTYIADSYESMDLTKDIVPDDMWSLFEKRGNITVDKGSVPATVRYVFVKDSDYFEWIGGLGLKEEDCVKDGGYLAVAYSDASIYYGKYYYGSLIKDSEKSVDVIHYQNDKPDVVIKREIAAYAHDVPMGMNKGNYMECVNLIYPYSARAAILGEEYVESLGYLDTDFFIKSDHPSETYDDLNRTLEDIGVKMSSVANIAAEVIVTRALVTVIKVFSYGFIVLISLISLANVFNTISTNVNLRRKEFAMLKSVGMSRRGFNRMMNYECVIYGVKGTIYGLPVSILINWFMSRSMDFGIQTKFVMPWGSMAIAVGSVFVVVFATMLYSMSKIRHDNTVETLRRETA